MWNPEPFSSAVMPGSSYGLSTPFLVDADVAFLLNTMKGFSILQEVDNPREPPHERGFSFMWLSAGLDELPGGHPGIQVGAPEHHLVWRDAHTRWAAAAAKLVAQNVGRHARRRSQRPYDPTSVLQLGFQMVCTSCLFLVPSCASCRCCRYSHLYSCRRVGLCPAIMRAPGRTERTQSDQPKMNAMVRKLSARMATPSQTVYAHGCCPTVKFRTA
jgi:hypothetical protein